MYNKLLLHSATCIWGVGHFSESRPEYMHLWGHIMCFESHHVHWTEGI